MDSSLRRLGLLASLAALALAGAAPVLAQQEPKAACVVLLMHGKGGSPQSLAGLAAKLKPTCLGRSPDMPWSARRGGDRTADEAMQEIARHVKELRQQGFQRVLLGGLGAGANAAIAYAGKVGDVDGVIALAPDDAGSGIGPLPAITERIRQHVPLLWVVGSADALHGKGEGYAFAKAPPHPSSRYVALKADGAGLAEASAKPLLEWAKSLE